MRTRIGLDVEGILRVSGSQLLIKELTISFEKGTLIVHAHIPAITDLVPLANLRTNTNTHRQGHGPLQVRDSHRGWIVEELLSKCPAASVDL